jgi:signal transduction histidine kinase
VVAPSSTSPQRKRDRAQALRRTKDELEQRVAERTASCGQRRAAARAGQPRRRRCAKQERTRIAREIHDELGSLLVALKMDTHWLGRRLDDRPKLQCKCHSMGG